MEEEQSAAAVPATAAAPVTAVEAPGPSFTDAAKPAAAVGTKASKSSKAGANPTSSTTSAAKGKKSHAAANDVPSSRKDGEAEAEAPLPSQAQVSAGPPAVALQSLLNEVLHFVKHVVLHTGQTTAELLMCCTHKCLGYIQHNCFWVLASQVQYDLLNALLHTNSQHCSKVWLYSSDRAY